MPKRKAKIIGLQDPSLHQKTTTELQKQQRGISGRLRSVLHNKQSTAALDEETRLMIKRARLEALEADNYIESTYANLSSTLGTNTTLGGGPSVEDEDFYIGEPETSKKITAIRPKLSNPGYQATPLATTASVIASHSTVTGRKGGGGRGGTTSHVVPPLPPTVQPSSISNTVPLPSTTIGILPSIATIIPKNNVKLRKLPDLLLYETSSLVIENKGSTSALNTVNFSNGLPLSSLPLYQGPTLLAEHSQTASVGLSSVPSRQFCMVCGYEGKYTCTKCGTRYCSSKCGHHHQETRCIVKPPIR